MKDPETLPQRCKRRRIVIDGENYYISVGRTFVHATVPRENDPLIKGTRLVVETLCKEISELLEEMDETDTTER